MNRIERRVAGAGGPRPGAAVCDPGRPNNNIQRGMLGGGLLSRRMNTSNISNTVNRGNRIVSNQIPGLNTLKNEDNMQPAQYSFKVTERTKFTYFIMMQRSLIFIL